MGKTRVYQLADTIGVDHDVLVSKINAMQLGFEVKNYMSVITDDEASTVREAVEKERRRLVVEERIRPTVIRRRSRKKPGEPDSDANEPTVEVVEAKAPAPTVRVRPAVKEPALPVVGPEEEPKPPFEVKPEPAVAVDETPPKVEVQPVVEAPPVITKNVEVKAPPVVDDDDDDDDGDDLMVVDDVIPIDLLEDDDELDIILPASVRIIPKPSNIAGFIDPDIIRKRLAKDNKTFTPGPARPLPPGERPRMAPAVAPKDGPPRRKVVSQRDLYAAVPGQKRRGGGRNAKGGHKSRGGEEPARQAPQAAEHKRVIRIADSITVGSLAHDMGVKSSEIIKMLMGMGMMMTVNQPVDIETSELIATEFGYTVQDVSFKEESYIEGSEDTVEELKLRAPVVTVMGHVDHGKTSLLDAIRNTHVTSSEAGGITQHIGASSVMTATGKVVFLDTPGHEAFTALRQRGAKVTDLVVLVVAADDGVMPQTVEAINHARAASTPIIVAINKIDKPGANPQRVKQALTEYELIPEEWGGSTIFVEVSALEGTNIPALLEMIQLQSELLELRANPDKPARGVVLEAFKHSGRGTVATLIVNTGTLRAGDIIVSGMTYGRVRTMNDETGKLVDLAGPSTPVEVTGLSEVPEAGEPFFVAADEKQAKVFTEQMRSRKRVGGVSTRRVDPWAALSETKELSIIIKADVQGSVEALTQSLTELSVEEVAVKVIHGAVGGITEGDVQLAIASNSLLVGFNTRPEARAAELAKREGVLIEQHSIIYDVIDRVREAMTGMLDPILEEAEVGQAEVRDTFSVPKVGTIAGCYVLNGRVTRGGKARLIRDGIVIYESKIATLRRFKDDVKEVKTGFECGLSVENYNDIKIGDRIEVYEIKEIPATLDERGRAAERV